MIQVRRVVLPVFLLGVSSFVLPQSTNDAIERRIDALLQQMTVEEKAGQVTLNDGDSPEVLELVRKGQVGALLNVLGAERTNAAQHLAVEQSRLKIPLLFGFDVIHGFRTVFPVPIGSASSFDPQLIEQAERVAAKEATAAGIKWAYAPMVDVARDPRWGRMVEGAGEDPYLGGVVGAARVRGFQGQNLGDPQSLIACVKHYAAYGAVEGGREYNTADISEQTLREVYLPPFHAGLEAGGATVMAAFQDLNGVPASANRHTLTDILRHEWGFNGLVVSDYNSVRELTIHGVARDEAEAAQMAFTAGVDMSMADGVYGKQLPALLESGKVPRSVLDEAVRRVLRLKFKAGLFEHPYTDPKRAQADILSPENLAVARRMAQESMVLLKNDKDLLPLDKGTKTIALIGPLADDKANQLGSWVANGIARDAVTPLEAIKAKLPNARILHAPGTDLELSGPHYDSGATGAAPAPSSATGAVGKGGANRPRSIQDAVSAAQKADVAIIFLGEPSNYTGEASARSTFDLPGEQQKLLEAVAATGRSVVLVLESGRPLDIRWANEHASAIIQAWYPGSQAGNAVADVIFGDASPSARLPISWPRSIGQIPVYYGHKNTGRPSSPDRWHTGYQFESKDPLFPFGYGLTYTQFKYGSLRVQTPTISSTETLRVTAQVQNAGTRAGTEVVQLYVHDRIAPTSRPVRELKGFLRVTLAPGERKNVEFSLSANALGSYDAKMAWIVPEGTYDVWVAPNAVEGVQGTFQVEGK